MSINGAWKLASLSSSTSTPAEAMFSPVRAGEKTSFSENCFVVCVLMLSTGAFSTMFPGESGVEFEEQGKIFAQILWTALYLLMFAFARKRIAELTGHLWKNRVLIALLVWAGLSTIWSIDRTATSRHFAALILSTFFGTYIGLRFQAREQIRLVGIALGIALFASVIACVFFPNIGISVVDDVSNTPAWQGVFAHKNTFGKMIVLAALVLGLYFVKRRRHALIGIGVLFVLVVLSEAKTALVYFVLGLILLSVARRLQTSSRTVRNRIVFVGAILFSGLVILLLSYWEMFTLALGKDPELTGRFALWGLALSWIVQKPWIGYGFDAFWSDYYGPAADFRVAVNWLAAPHAHNGLINLCLDLGLVGVVLFLIGLFGTFHRALRIARNSIIPEDLWPICFMTYWLVYSLTEMNFLSRNELCWILYVSLSVGIGTTFGGRAAVGIQSRRAAAPRPGNAPAS